MRRGMSLIVLIISIIVMIIIAGAVIITLADGGIITKVIGAVKVQGASAMKEELILALTNLKMHIYEGTGEKTSYYEDKDKFAINGQLNTINKEIIKYIVNPENDDEIMLEIKYKDKESTYAYKLNVDSCKVEILDGINTTEKTIAYVLNGGTNEEGAVTKYTEGEVVNLPNPTKEGFIFAGWYAESNFSGECLTRTTVDTRGSLTLYARWAAAADASYFNWTVSGTNATITGLSTAGISAYDSGNLAEVVFPKTYVSGETTYNVTTINGSAFSGRINIQSVIIPKSINTIGTNTFYNCGQVAGEFKVTLEAGRTTLSNEFFQGANYLKEITVPEGVTSIQGYNYNNYDGYSSGAFKSCTSLANVTLPSTLTSIGQYVFFGCTSLTEMPITSNVTIIGHKAYKNCKFTTVNIPSSVETIESAVFSNCTNLTSVTLPETNITLGSSTFDGCTKLESITIPKNVTSIGADSFYNCGQVAGEFKVTLEAGRTTLSKEFFQGANYLKEITVPEGVTSIQGYNYYNDGYSSGAFKSCTSLANVTLPSTLTSIGQYVFFGCTSLTEVLLPANMAKIDYKSFKNCTALATINYNNTVESWSSVTKGTDWNTGTIATGVICTNGTVNF